MTAFTLDALCHESPFVLRLVRRHAAKRAATAGMILAVCALAGIGMPVAAVLAAILATEASAALAWRHLPPEGVDAEPRLALWVWGTNVLSTVAYLVPALLLAGRPEVHWVICGYLWVFGVCVHISNSFVALPVHNRSQMAFAFAMGLATTATAGLAHGAAADPGPWLVVLGALVVYGVNTVETISQQKETQRELDAARAEARARLAALEKAARVDPLTGLLNRQAFDAALAGLVAERRPGREVAVLSVDLDGFKPLNDTYGHAAGDAVLTATGRRLAALAGGVGVAGRLGGDELAIALPGLRSSRAALDLALRLAREVERPVLHDGKALRVGGSVGVALTGAAPEGPGHAVASSEPAAAALADRLLAAADGAMLRAKATARLGGESRPVLHDPTAEPDRPSDEDRLRLAEALARGEVQPRYAPVRDLATSALAGFDAEATWAGPWVVGLDRSALLARIPELGLQGDLLMAMAGRVLCDLDALVAGGLDPGRVALPIPEMALATRNGRRDLDRLLAQHPSGRARLAATLPGDVLANRAGDMVRDGVAHLRSMGVAIAIAGFGTGRASFRHLAPVAFDELRLDAGFVAGLERDPGARAVAEALGVVARGFGGRLVAEGVETEEQRRLLLRHGCELGHGPLLGRPVDAAGLGQLLGGLAAPARAWIG